MNISMRDLLLFAEIWKERSKKNPFKKKDRLPCTTHARMRANAVRRRRKANKVAYMSRKRNRR